MTGHSYRPLVATLAGGIALAAVAAFYGEFGDRWHGVVATVGVVVVIAAGIAVFERRSGKLSVPLLTLVLVLPAVLVHVAMDYGPTLWFVSNLSVFAAAIGTPYWYVPLIAVPLAYALGRAETKAWQRRIGTILVVALLLSLGHFLLPGGDLKLTRPLDVAILVAAVCTWAAIPLYRLGTRLRDWAEPDASPHLVPGIVAGILSVWLLGGIALSVGEPRADLLTTAVVFTLQAGLVLYFAHRARRLYRTHATLAT